MNERIKELSNIAYINHMERNPHSSFGRRYDYDKEFAELIVKECANAFWTEDCNVSDLALEEYNRNSKKIKQHFGVEQ